MESRPKSLGNLAMDTAREYALSRSIAFSKYGDLLGRFGNGDVKPTELSEGLAKVAFEDAIRYAHDAIKLGGKYVEFLSKLTRASDITEFEETLGLTGKKSVKSSKRRQPRPQQPKKKRASVAA